MVIMYHGGAFVKVVFGDTTIAVNPISKNSKLKPARFGADIALLSLQNVDFNGVEQVSHGERQPFIVSGPGEYEIRKIFIKGVSSISKYSGEDSINTIYTVSLEGMRLCFLGALSEKKLTTETKEALGVIDVVFVPISGGGVLTASGAYELAVMLGAKIIIPTLHDSKSLKVFLKEGGEENKKALDKLTIKKKDIDGKDGEIVVLGN